MRSNPLVRIRFWRIFQYLCASSLHPFDSDFNKSAMREKVIPCEAPVTIVTMALTIDDRSTFNKVIESSRLEKEDIKGIWKTMCSNGPLRMMDSG